MDVYFFSLALGGVGLGVLALGGLGHHGHGHGHGHHAHGHHGHGHAPGHAHHGHAHHGASAHQAGTPGHAGHDGATHAHAAGVGPTGGALGATLWTLSAPRGLFSILLGFGATGMIVRGVVGAPAGGVLLLAIALLGGLAFERLAVRPVLAFLFGFASTPASSLDSTMYDEARASSGFDANGEGLIAIELDGQVVQVLGTLRSQDRALGIRVRAGDRLRIEDVDGARHRCTVSFLGRP
jgi:hypothetical protein